jgi:hypothetical protein
MEVIGVVYVATTGNKLRRLMMFAWPCLLVKNCVDPATRYHGHLLLSHIIAKFAIHKRIVLQGECHQPHTTVLSPLKSLKEPHSVVCPHSNSWLSSVCSVSQVTPQLLPSSSFAVHCIQRGLYLSVCLFLARYETW